MQAEDIAADMDTLAALITLNTPQLKSVVDRLADYLFGAVVPMLHQLLTVHFSKLTWTKVIRAFSNAMQSKLLNFVAVGIVVPKYADKVDALLSALGVGKDKLKQDDDEVPMTPTTSSLVGIQADVSFEVSNPRCVVALI